MGEAESLRGRLAQDARDSEFLNVPVSESGTDRQHLLLRELAPEPQPDVGCDFCANDLFENGSQAAHGKDAPWFELRASEFAMHSASPAIALAGLAAWVACRADQSRS